MDRNEKLEFQQKIEAYFEERRVYDLFEKLLRELVITKPKDPIDYLVHRIKKKDCIIIIILGKRIFITGTPGTNRKNIALYVSDILQIACICVRDLLENEIKKKLETGKLIEKKFKAGQLVDDEIVIDLVKKEMIKYEKDNVSYIVEGFPKNRVKIC